MEDATARLTKTTPLPDNGLGENAGLDEPCSQPAPSLPSPHLHPLEAIEERLPPRITPREKEILGLIAAGLTDQQIAERLWMSVHTVHRHQANLREKFQVHNRTALVWEAERYGYLAPKPQKWTILAIGEAPHPGYTQGQQVAPQPSQDAHGNSAADEQGETEMLNHTSLLWCLAALLAVGAGARAAGKPATDIGIRRVWAGPGVDLCGAPSPDGRYLSFVDWDTGDLAIRDLTTGKHRRLTNKGSWYDSGDYAEYSTFSPDGRQIAYAWSYANDHCFDLRLVGRDGARPRILYRNEAVKHIRPFAWTPDGKQILALFSQQFGSMAYGPHQIVLVSVADGSVRVLKTLDWGRPGKISLSPDGRTISYDLPKQVGSSEREIFLLDTGGSEATPLLQHSAHDHSPFWAPDGQSLLFASDRMGPPGLWRVPVAGGKPQGAPELVKREIGVWRPLGLTRSGSLYYGLQAGAMEDVYIAALDPEAGTVLSPPRPADPHLVGYHCAPAWSPDGRHLAYLSIERNSLRAATGPDQARRITIRSVATGKTRELAPELESVLQPIWSTDGRFLLATGKDSSGHRGAFRINALTGAVTAIPQMDRFMRPAVWTHDGTSILYGENQGIRARSIETGQEQELARTGVVEDLALSPDGRQLAFTANRALFVMLATGGEPRELMRVPSPDKLLSLAWMPDGRHLLFARLKLESTAWWKRTTEVWQISVDGGEPRPLGVSMNRLRGIRVHPDGRQIAFTAGEPEVEVWVMENSLPAAQSARATAPRR